MKITIVLLLVLLSFIPYQVLSSSFGISPSSVSTQITRGSVVSLGFTAVGYNGVVGISVNNMPVSITPSSITVTEGVPFTVVLKCNSDAVFGTYDGRIRFLSQNGGSVLAGVDIICSLLVRDGEVVSLVANVVSNGNGGSFDSGGGYQPVEIDWSQQFPSMIQKAPQSSSAYIPPKQQPVIIPPVVGNPPQNIVPTEAPVTKEKDNTDVMIIAFILAGAAVLFLILYIVIPREEK